MTWPCWLAPPVLFVCRSFITLIILNLTFITVIDDLVSFMGKDCVLLAHLLSIVFNNPPRVITQRAFIRFETVVLTYDSKHNILYYLWQQLSHGMLANVQWDGAYKGLLTSFIILSLSTTAKSPSGLTMCPAWWLFIPLAQSRWNEGAF